MNRYDGLDIARRQRDIPENIGSLIRNAVNRQPSARSLVIAALFPEHRELKVRLDASVNKAMNREPDIFRSSLNRTSPTLMTGVRK